MKWVQVIGVGGYPCCTLIFTKTVSRSTHMYYRSRPDDVIAYGLWCGLNKLSTRSNSLRMQL